MPGHTLWRGYSRGVKWLLCVWITCVPLFLSGCFDRKELEQQAFVTVMGIDQGPTGTIDCTFELASPQSPEQGSSSATTSPKRVVVRAHSLAEALTVANASLERTLSFTHLTMIVFGESLSQAGLGSVIQSLVRFREFRGTIFLAVAKGSAQDMMQSFQPVLEKSSSRSVESVALVGQELGIMPVTYLNDFTRFMQMYHAACLVPLFAVNEAVKNDTKGEQPITADVEPQLTAGSLPRTGGNPVEWSGGAVFRGDKLVDLLDGDEVRDINLLRGRVRRSLITFDDPVQKQAHIGLKLHPEGAPSYDVALTKPLRIHVVVPLEADIENTQSDVDYTQPQMRGKLEKSVDEQINKSLTAVLKKVLTKDMADVIPVSNQIRGRFATHKQFANYAWEQKLKDAEISVDTELHIRRFGIQIEPVTDSRDRAT